MRAHLKLLALVAALAIVLPVRLAQLSGQEPAAPEQPADATYLFTSFRGNGDGLHLAWSNDALHWREIPGVQLASTLGSGLMRDPHLLRGPDGVYRLLWTTGWHDRVIGYASSTNLREWSTPRSIPVMESTPGTHNCWAPESFYDARSQECVITWSSDVEGRFPDTVSNDRMNNRTYYVTTKDFETFSEAKLLFDPGFDNIDATLMERDGRYLVVFKEGDKQQKSVWGPIHAATADAATGPFTVADKPLVTRRAEGPALVQVGDRTLMYVDFYSDGRYGIFATSDADAWDDVSDQGQVVSGQRHGTILTVPGEDVRSLLKASAEKLSQELAKAPKPILDGFTADPGIRVFGDRYYVYPTSDKPNWQTTDFSVWSSPNLVDWKKEGMVLDVAHDLAWANIEAWAPDAIERDGTYYFYFCGQHKIGVATAKSPTGPFVDALGKPLLKKEGKITTNTIDPYPFIDDDDQAYLYFGNGNNEANVFRLKPDMISLDGDPVVIPLRDFREGIVVFKRQGRYYFMWSIDDARSDDYRVGYGWSESPLGPVESPQEFVVLHKNGIVKGTGHHSVVNVPGTDRWYVAYHRHAIPIGGGYQRETCLARMDFNDDGTIRPIDPLNPAFAPGSGGEPLDP